MTAAITISELASALDATLVGDGERTVSGVRALDQAGAEHLSFLHNPRYVEQARSSAAGVILVADAATLPGRTLLVTDQPYLALARALEILHPPEQRTPGRHPSAVVDPSAEIDPTASIGACCVVSARCVVGANVDLGPGVVLGREARIGAASRLHANVTIGERCTVGERCVLHSGVVIGSDGFGFATVDGVHHKVPQIGIVVVEDDVELGANVCVDRATLGETRIGRGTKVDNLVQIAHNVTVGEGTLLVAQVGIAGSTQLGHHVIMAGQSGVAGHLRIGDRAVVESLEGEKGEV